MARPSWSHQRSVGLRPGCRAGQSIASLCVFWWKSVTNALCVAILEDNIQSHTVPLRSPVIAESHLNMSLHWEWSQASFFQRGRCRPTPSHCLHQICYQICSYTINTAFSVSSRHLDPAIQLSSAEFGLIRHLECIQVTSTWWPHKQPG